MYSLLLVIIYVAFISLGLPDSLLGAGWPAMVETLEVPLSYGGILTMMIAIGTICSSLLSDRLTKTFGVGQVTAFSVALTAIALFGFANTSSFLVMALLTIPYGIGAGAVDAALNNFVALHYASKHMNWLHCCWGVGASVSPYIMGVCLSENYGWDSGFFSVALLQIVLSVLIFCSLPLWKKQKAQGQVVERKHLSMGEIFKIKGVSLVLITFFCYCALEGTAGLWVSSYLIGARGFSVEMAAQFASFFFLGITGGRFLSGFISEKIGDGGMIRYGLLILLTGTVLLLLPMEHTMLPLIGLLVMGLGCAPVYPAVIHATPANFGAENSQAIVGVQMASAYVGSTFAPPIFGVLASHTGMKIFPLYLMVFIIVMLFASEKLGKTKEGEGL